MSISFDADIPDLNSEKGELSFLSIFFSLLFFFILYQYINSFSNVDIGHFPNHKSIGTKIIFKQPMCYTIRKHDSIVPFVARIEKELSKAHTKHDSEKVNIPLPDDAIYIISDVYSYSDVMNRFRLYFVLKYNDIDYILDEESLENYQNKK